MSSNPKVYPSGVRRFSRVNRNDPGSDFAVMEYTEATHPGISLRDYFAGQVIGHLSALQNNCTVTDLATEAYQYADAMLAEREKRHGD